MKQCRYCGAEYPDDATLCATDRQPLAFWTPKPPCVQNSASGGGDSRWSLLTRLTNIVMASLVTVVALVRGLGEEMILGGLSTEDAVVGVVMLMLALSWLVAAVGLWLRRRWAWYVSLLAALVVLLLSSMMLCYSIVLSAHAGINALTEEMVDVCALPFVLVLVPLAFGLVGMRAECSRKILHDD
jgi:hypothetical protein